MKFLVCFVAALAVTQTVYGRRHHFSDESEELREPPRPSDVRRYEYMGPGDKADALRRILKQYHYTKDMEDVKVAAEKVCPYHGEAFVNATLKTVNCLELIDENQETSCSLVQNHLSPCMQAPIAVLEECLPEKARGLPSLVFKMIIKISNKLCKTDGEHIFELGNPCVMSMNHKTETCIRRVRARAQQYMQKTPSAQDVCEFLVSLRPCVESHLEASCGNEKTRESFKDIFEAAVSSCDFLNTNVIEDADNNAGGQYEIVDMK